MTPTLSIEQARAWFAEDLRVIANLRSPALVEALATVPRERFLGPGPWTLLGPGPGMTAGLDPAPAARPTDSEDPRHVYHNLSIAIDSGRMLVNGQPSLLASWLDALAIAPGDRVLHVGCGTGYYSALAGAMAGPSGRVVAVEIEEALASQARANLKSWPWIEVRHGDGRTDLPRDCDVVLINAGATHVLDEWLDVVRAGGRLLVPLTVTMPGMRPTLGKGLELVLARGPDGWSARAGGIVVIYSLVGARDEAMNSALGRALMRGPRPEITRLRRDPHDPAEACWLHGTTNCLCR
jgi:protein-L-isoaspartate(D-aspartate) O-methyltransferase